MGPCAYAAELERERAAQRLRNYRTAAAILKQRGALRDGLSVERAAATMFAVGHPETYRTLVLNGDWDERRWSSWARTTLEAALLRT